jgi:hypothetical protein
LDFYLFSLFAHPPIPVFTQVGVYDDSSYNLAKPAARARAGGCITAWNPMKGVRPAEWKFQLAFCTNIESLTPVSAATISQMGKYPPVKGGPDALENDGLISIDDKDCQKKPLETDITKQSKEQQKGSVLLTKVGIATKSTVCAVCKTKGDKIAKKSLHFTYHLGKFDKHLHPSCVQAENVPGDSRPSVYLEMLGGFGELPPEDQESLRSLPLFFDATKICI